MGPRWQRRSHRGEPRRSRRSWNRYLHLDAQRALPCPSPYAQPFTFLIRAAAASTRARTTATMSTLTCGITMIPPRSMDTSQTPSSVVRTRTRSKVAARRARPRDARAAVESWRILSLLPRRPRKGGRRRVPRESPPFLPIPRPIPSPPSLPPFLPSSLPPPSLPPAFVNIPTYGPTRSLSAPCRGLRAPSGF